jgi:hypothetical protein
MKAHDNIENLVDHEVRIRLLERIADSIDKRFDRLDEKMDNQFKWIIGTMVTMIGGLILTKVF